MTHSVLNSSHEVLLRNTINWCHNGIKQWRNSLKANSSCYSWLTYWPTAYELEKCDKKDQTFPDLNRIYFGHMVGRCPQIEKDLKKFYCFSSDVKFIAFYHQIVCIVCPRTKMHEFCLRSLRTSEHFIGHWTFLSWIEKICY